ncbi:catecholate siderophore receptor Fiu [Methylibium sp.]|uniref:catecholate siderophore receptor Fiu n=1 Tax=Methylibium sp. TaxID=2067992 RepID=UPI0033417AFA
MAYIQARKHAHPPRRTASAAAAFAALAIPAAVHAQQAAAPADAASAPASTQVLPEIKAKSTVETPYKAEAMSSPKFTQPLVDTPQTITVIKKELLREQGATTLSEALRNTPGVTMLMGENGNTSSGDSIFMRGFDTSGSIFVDGIRDLGFISRDVFNIEQVEVVKGPSGADNGRGASSGYVNLSSKVPFAENFNAASLSLGTASRKRATADLNRPLDIGVPGTAVRLNLMVQDSGVPGRDEVEKKSYGFAPSIAFGLNTPTRAYFYLLHSKQDNLPDGGVPTYGVGNYKLPTTAPAGVPTPTPVDSENFYGSRSDYEKIDIDMFTARVEHDVAPGITLRNTSRYGRSTQDSVLTGVNAVNFVTPADPSTYTVNRSRQRKYQQNEILTNQSNITAELGSGAVKHSVTGGVEFTYEKQSLPTFALPTGVTQDPANLYDPSLGDVFQTPVRNGAYAKGNTLTAAVYAFDTLKVGEQWQFTGGVRWEKYRTEFNSMTLTDGVLVPLALDASGNLLSWKLGALFKPAPNGSVYVSVASSELPPGGANHTLSANANNVNQPNLDPQEGSNIEVGTKWEFLGGKLAIAGAIFRSENKNELVQDPIDTTVYTQVGKRRVQGIELSVVGQLTNELHLSAGLARMDPEIERAAAATQGGLIQWSPELTFTSWLTYKLPFGLTLGGGARYVDNATTTSNVDTSTVTGLTEMPSYWVADALVGYEFSKNFNLQLNVYNLFDKEYLSAVNSGRSRYFPGVPRSALLTANVQF